MPELVIRRVRGWYGKFRAFLIFVDDVRVGKIREGETWRYPISEGAHSARLKIDWHYGPTEYFSIGTDDVEFTISGKIDWLAVREYLIGSFNRSPHIAPVYLERVVDGDNKSRDLQTGLRRD